MKKFFYIFLVLFLWLGTGTNSLQAQNGLNFDGANDYVDCGNSAALQLSTGTIETWVKTSSAGAGYRGIIVKQFAYSLFLVDNVLTVFNWSSSTASSTSVNLADGQWHHVAMSFQSGVSNGTRVYVDGVLRTTITLTVSAQTAPLTLGAGSTTDQYLNGVLENTRIWNTVRTAAEIANYRFTETAGNETGLVAAYNYNQGTASGTNMGVTTLNDVKGNTNGTLTNFALTGATSNWVTGLTLATGLSFDGTNDYVNCGNAANLQVSTGTIEGWIKTSGAGASYRGIVAKESAYSLFLRDNVLVAYDWVNGEKSTGVNLADGQWHHVALSFQPTANLSKIYIDGVPRLTITSAWGVSDQTKPLLIGEGNIVTFGQSFNGTIDEVRVWNTARTDAQIANNRSSELVGNETGLVAYYKFNQGIAAGTNTGLTTLTDATTNANNGTLTNFALTGATSNWVTSDAIPSVVTPSVSVAASATTICAGTSVTFTATPTNGGTPTYAWLKNGTTISGQTGATYTTTGLANGDIITCTMTSSLANASPTTATSTGITMTVNPSVTPSVAIAASPNGAITEGTSVTFTATPTNGGTTPQYQWQKGGANISGATIATYTSTTLANGDVITCVMTSNATCVTTATATSTGITMSVIPASTTTTIYNFESLSVGTLNGKDNWRVSGGGGGAVINTTTSGLYTGSKAVNLTSYGNAAFSRVNNTNWSFQSFNCATSLTIEATMARNWWYQSFALGYDKNGNGQFASNGYVAEANERSLGFILAQGNLYIIKADGSTSAGVSVSDLGNLGNYNRYRLVVNLTANNNAGSGTLYYRNLTSSGAWTVVPGLENTNMAINTASANQDNIFRLNGLVSMNDKDDITLDDILISTTTPTVSIAASAEAITPGQSVTFTATPANVGNSPTYQWYKGGVAISGATNATYTTTTLATGDVITCVLTNTTGCSSTSNSITITVSAEALNFDGTDDYVSINTGTSSLSGSFTVECWIKPTSFTNLPTPTLFSSRTPNEFGTDVQLTASGNLHAAIGNGDSFITTSADVTANLVTNTWYHIALVVTSTGYTYYKNGVNIGGGSFSGTPLLFNSTHTLVLGSGGFNPSGSSFQGSMDEFRVWNVARSASEIANNRSCALAGNETGLVAYYKFNQGTPAGTNTGLTALTDATTNARNGTLTNFALTGATSNWVASDAITIVTPSVAIAASPSGAINAGESVTFTATPTNGGSSPTYQWKKNGINVGTNSATYTDAALANGNVITCVMTSNAACVTSTTATSTGITMAVIVTPSVSIAASETTICKGKSVTFTATPTNGGTPTYVWKKNGNVITGQTDATYATTSLANRDVISCTMTSSLTNVSVTTATSIGITVTVNDLPVVNFVILGLTGSQVVFGNRSTPGGLLWDFGDPTNPTTSTSQNPFFWYKTNGRYFITLTVTSEAGCVNSLTQYIDITKVRTDVSDIQEALKVSVYPNPFSEQLVMVIENEPLTLGKDDRLVVTNVIGQVVLQRPLTSKTIELNTSNWAEGLYNLTIYSNGQAFPIKKVAKITK